MGTTSRSAVRLEFHTDPGEFLAAAGGHLAADPVMNTVVTTAAHRTLAQLADGLAQPDHNWWLVVRDDSGAVLGAGMRAAPHPLFLLPMPDDASVALAHTLHRRGEEVLGVNGTLPAVDLCAAELARLGGGHVEVGKHTRLHELGELVQPASVPGRLVAAAEENLELVLEWVDAFAADADAQAGRPANTTPPAVDERRKAEALRRIRAGLLWLWVDGTGQPVHLTGAMPPSFGVARIAPVYTPPSQRGRGWASNAVAEVSRRLQAEGARVCLFTDQANPISNRIYAALGYRAVADMAELVIVR
jgi:RimJ/RimL family protein N-acetyltransferase